ncbi:MAG: VOC family protein [Saprospiraceae bacterium]|nr:VOC family protein [Saprospiraceae bacterium]
MKFIPILKVRNIKAAVEFYTHILDFELKYPDDELNIFAVDLVKGDLEMMLTEIDGIFGVSNILLVDQIDNLYETYLKRGLKTPQKADSPIHEGPINQSWGMREFYVTDADGNTIRFSSPINKNFLI